MTIQFFHADEVHAGILAVSEELGFALCQEQADLEVMVETSEENISSVSLSSGKARILYGGGKSRFFRALAHLLQWLKDGVTECAVTEHPVFESNGAMIDMSRNAVMNVPTVKTMLRKMALMGMDTFMLYTEDTYEIEGRPYFGYMRGRYTKSEIKELDAYAADLGIELIPCVQFLGHMPTHLSWLSAAPYKDTERVMLVGSEETYKLIDDILKTVCECFTTKKIHIGMDETMDLGLGKYLTLNGYRERHEIFLEHLNKVTAMVKSYGLQPMMWSDMFFRMAGKDIPGYYDYHPAVQLPDYICNAVPEGVTQVFWDYYQDSEEFYTCNIEKHKLLGDHTVFAGGVWGWSGYAVLFSRSLKKTRPALEACKKKGVKDVIATVWHNGSEAQLITSLAGIAWYADFGYTGEFNEESIKACFRRACGDWYDAIMKTEAVEYPHGSTGSIAKALVYNDPLTGLLDKHIAEQKLTGTYYKQLSAELKSIGQDSGIFEPSFAVIRSLSSLLENKTDFSIRLIKAYQDGNHATLAALAEECDEIIEKLTHFKDTCRNAWMTYNKPFGYEVHDIRLGGNIARFETAKQRILDYLDGRIPKIEELEEERLYLDCRNYRDDENKFSDSFVWKVYRNYATANIL